MDGGKQSSNEVVIYHDETKNVNSGKYKGHVFLFVPIKATIIHNSPLLGLDIEEYNPSNIFYEKILELRKTYQINHKLHFSEIAGRRWSKTDIGVRMMSEVSVEALKHKFVQMFKKPILCKLSIMFYPKKPNFNLYGGGARKEQQLRYDETIMRIMLKGALHYLYDATNKIRFVALYSDGKPDHRPLDFERVVHRIKYDGQYGRTPLRDYVEFSPNAQVIHLQSDHNLYPASDEKYKHANFLQLADILLGSVIRSCYSGIQTSENLPKIRSIIGEPKHKKDIIACPVWKMLEKRNRKKGFKNSGHYKTFSLNELTFENSQPNFRTINTIDDKIFTNTPMLDFEL